MKLARIIVSYLFVLFVSNSLAGTYGDSLGFFEFETGEELAWEQDDQNNEAGLGQGGAKNSGGGVYQLTTIDLSKLEWNIETFPDSFAEKFQEGDTFKEIKDVTKEFEDGTTKRYIELAYSLDGKKVKVWLICAEKAERLAVLLISCNRDGRSIAKGDPSKVLLSLTAK